MNRFVTACAALAIVAGAGGCAALKGGKKKTPVVGDRVPILMSENSITVDKTLAGIEVVLPPAVANDAWNQPGGSASKSMGHLALADSPREVWRVRVPGGDNRVRLAAAPTIDG
ncbi:MAG TPA: pyrrolo-quinoline quinone, partial [Sphingomonas sp.]|nr:pyrrolo-quinoline quinone [Sphingomonas sp.]